VKGVRRVLAQFATVTLPVDVLGPARGRCRGGRVIVGAWGGRHRKPEAGGPSGLANRDDDIDPHSSWSTKRPRGGGQAIRRPSHRIVLRSDLASAWDVPWTTPVEVSKAWRTRTGYFRALRRGVGSTRRIEPGRPSTAHIEDRASAAGHPPLDPPLRRTCRGEGTRIGCQGRRGWRPRTPSAPEAARGEDP